jgi:hypothetical protein
MPLANVGDVKLAEEPKAPSGAPSAPTPGNGTASIPYGIWWEYAVAEATAGYDADSNRTLIYTFDLIVRGPSSVETAIRGVVETCISVSAAAAYEAFKSTSSPEVGGRIGAAWAAFHVAVTACFSTHSIVGALKDQFEIGYIRRGVDLNDSASATAVA